MQKEIILRNPELICASGNAGQTCTALYNGISAVVPGPSFGAAVPHAPFHDTTLRSLDNITKALNFMPPADQSSLLFIYACAKGDLSALESYYHGNKDSHLEDALLETQAKRLPSLLGIKPKKTVVISSACASGAVAVDFAREQLMTGAFSDVVIFGYDVLCEFVVKGFNCLNALSSEPAKPFDKSRNGLTLGDGAAAAHLTLDIPKNGDIIICGCGTSNDANHRTGPSRTGEGLLRAIQSALTDSRLTPSDIGAVKCHGTATNYNDAMEAKALYSCFGDNIPPAISLKGAIGHMSGAGSLVEIILASSFLKKGLLPPTIGYTELGVDEPVKISGSVQEIDKKPMLCLAAGFGGQNAAVIIREQL